MTLAPTPHAQLLRRGRMLEWITLAWNIAGVVVLAILALTASSAALRLIGVAFIALAVYLLVAATIALITQHHAGQSSAGIVWTAVTAAVMFALAAGKARTGRARGNPVLVTEGKVTLGGSRRCADNRVLRDPRSNPHCSRFGQRSRR
jgi:peptidoglycan/LPS O-acetylase OafA/YrhL